MIKENIYIVLLIVLISMLSACVQATTPAKMLPTSIPPLSTETPTATTIWFPPTVTNTPFPTPIITPTLDIRPHVGEIILSDDFSEPTPWFLNQTSTTSIALGNNELTLALNQPGGYLFSLRHEPILDDFFLEITASPSLCLGEDEYGLLLRVSPTLDFYRFSLSCDGRVRLDKYYQNKASSPQPFTISGAVPPGAPSSSLISVWAKDKEMHFYINNEFQFSVSDPSLSLGTLGVFVRSAGDNAVTVTYSDLTIYESVGELPKTSEITPTPQ